LKVNEMKDSFDIDGLAASLTPVRRVRARDGMLTALGAAVLTSLVVVLHYGLRTDLAAGEPHPMVMLRGGMLALLGIATTIAAIAAARPAVGQGQNGWAWALAAAAIMPVTAAAMFLYHKAMDMPFGPNAMDFAYAGYCVRISGLSALLIGGMLTLWLRTGAPTALNRTGWLVGLAAGSFGTFAYSLHCPSDSIYYIGLWYSLAVGICAVVGRLIVPHLIRW
jgi:hypothetical protein